MQWRKPLAVVAPVVKPITVYRSAHLLCARRMHRPLILVIVQAGWIEWQVQPIEQTPDFSIDIFHYLFILHAQDAAGQSGIHMCCHTDIIAIISRQSSQVGRKAGLPVEISGESGKAASGRMAPDINNLCVGQDEVDQWRESPVRRHLVSEIRPVGPSMSM